MKQMKIDPWSTTIYQDYIRLRNEFGIEEFSEDLSDNIFKELFNEFIIKEDGVL